MKQRRPGATVHFPHETSRTQWHIRNHDEEQSSATEAKGVLVVVHDVSVSAVANDTQRNNCRETGARTAQCQGKER